MAGTPSGPPGTRAPFPKDMPMTSKSVTRPGRQPGDRAPRAAIAAKTLRTDRWWLAPLLTVVGLSAWVVYATVRVFMHKWYWVEQYHYLTPVLLALRHRRAASRAPRTSAGSCPAGGSSRTRRFTLPFLLLFRLTCYYYRKAYYRSFWLSPPACAVPDGHATYTGETRFPLIFQNLHRYFFYAAVLISLINTWDAILRLPRRRAASASAWATSSCWSTW